jgi:hypothetical protein
MLVRVQYFPGFAATNRIGHVLSVEREKFRVFLSQTASHMLIKKSGGLYPTLSALCVVCCHEVFCFLKENRLVSCLSFHDPIYRGLFCSKIWYESWRDENSWIPGLLNTVAVAHTTHTHTNTSCCGENSLLSGQLHACNQPATTNLRVFSTEQLTSCQFMVVWK